MIIKCQSVVNSRLSQYIDTFTTKTDDLTVSSIGSLYLARLWQGSKLSVKISSKRETEIISAISILFCNLGDDKHNSP